MNTQAMLNAFDDHLDRIEDEIGLEFTDEQRDAIYRDSLGKGFTPDATETAAARAAANHLGIDLGAKHQAPDDQPHDLELAEAMTVGRDTAIDIDKVARDIGRPLLREEQDALIDKTGQYFDRFGKLPEADFAMNALREHHGGDVPDTSTHRGRTWLAAQKLHEAESPVPEEDDSLDELDLDNYDDRLRYRVARLQGVEFESETDDAPDDSTALEEAA